jgi:hypothetical protein
MTAWEYLIVALPEFKATTARGESESVTMLNKEGAQGWEAVAMTAMPGGAVAVLLRKPVASRHRPVDDAPGDVAAPKCGPYPTFRTGR